MKTTLLTILCCVGLLCGCCNKQPEIGHTSELQAISLTTGMTKMEVLRPLGFPARTSADLTGEKFYYVVDINFVCNRWIYIRFSDGRVSEWGDWN